MENVQLAGDTSLLGEVFLTCFFSKPVEDIPTTFQLNDGKKIRRYISVGGCPKEAKVKEKSVSWNAVLWIILLMAEIRGSPVEVGS